MPTIQVNDHAIYYEEYGKGDPLVLIAGLGSSGLLWWKQVEPLGQQFRVIVPDNRGIGNSSNAAQAFTIADLAADMAALIRELRLAPSHVMGISMGGFIALTLGSLYPELVEKLILVSTSAGGADHVPAGKEILDIILDRNQSSIETYCRNLYPALAGAGYMQNHPEDLDRIVANALAKPLSPDTYLYQLNAIVQYTSAENKANAPERIGAPTLILHGDADPLVPYPNGRYLADHIKGAQFITYPGCGHLLPIEAADQLNEEVIAFLK